MMRKILILSLGILSSAAFANSAQEEALILNQELQFLENSVTATEAVSLNTKDTEINRSRAINDSSLERIYFEETEEDTISTRTASPKRRGF